MILPPATLGILGGGQLGRMLIQKGLDWNIPFSVLDSDPQAPCSGIASFTAGALTDYETVVRFGEGSDINDGVYVYGNIFNLYAQYGFGICFHLFRTVGKFDSARLSPSTG